MCHQNFLDEFTTILAKQAVDLVATIKSSSFALELNAFLLEAVLRDFGLCHYDIGVADLIKIKNAIENFDSKLGLVSTLYEKTQNNTWASVATSVALKSDRRFFIVDDKILDAIENNGKYTGPTFFEQKNYHTAIKQIGGKYLLAVGMPV